MNFEELIEQLRNEGLVDWHYNRHERATVLGEIADDQTR